jgi:hypothetical protein
MQEIEREWHWNLTKLPCPRCGGKSDQRRTLRTFWWPNGTRTVSEVLAEAHKVASEWCKEPWHCYGCPLLSDEEAAAKKRRADAAWERARKRKAVRE